VKRLFRRAKDATIGIGARAAINSKLGGIGEVTELAIDTGNRTIRVQLELLGEHEPIDISITEYELHRNPRGAQITIHRARASRQWMNSALEQFVIGKSFPIPAKAEPFLKLLG
jgi:hypothetical protein